ncbi:biotin transporter BioY [Paenibacillus turpanensis]|uniref:biotin transporter BioY n=1 Tax=Paenibacillus turpanensis TaxID=2689078 RepID=UPI00140E2BFF|nr:biotin transporter BioY [Paenibacillus turpanensis]
MSKTKSAWTVRGIVFSAMFSALMVAMSFMQIHLGFTPVPITLETMAIMLAGGILGAAYGFLSIFTVVFLVFLGLPLLHGQGGLPLVTGPTGGFIWMFPISALLVGWTVSRIKGTGTAAFIKIFLAIEIFGSLLLYITGVPWLAHKVQVSFSKAMLMGCTPYLIPDALKALAATAVVIAVRKAFPAWSAAGSSRPNVVADNNQTLSR